MIKGGSDLGKVRGLGSARSGVHHWTLQRLTALANIGLFAFALIALLRIDVSDASAVARWLSSLPVAVAMSLLLISLFWHIRLGLQVLIEDYVHSGALKLAALVALNFYAVGGVAFGLFAIARVAFFSTGAPI